MAIDKGGSGCDSTVFNQALGAGDLVLFNISVDLIYVASQPCDALLQIEARSDPSQQCHQNTLTLQSGEMLRQLDGEDGFGVSRWINITDQLACRYDLQASVTRETLDLAQLNETPRYLLPPSALQYLLPSRNCQSDLFLDFTAQQFDGLRGGLLVLAMRDWVHDNFTYDIFATYGGTTATDSFASLRGVCRDYAHVLISFLRAAGLPARFVSCYAPDVKPQDFHAVVEVFLNGDWHLVDPTGMAEPNDIIKICAGRDAGDTSFLTSYGYLTLQDQCVQVSRARM